METKIFVLPVVYDWLAFGVFSEATSVDGTNAKAWNVIYVYIYVYAYIYIHMYMYVCIYVCMHIL
jgi:hypothetical protein